MRIRALVAVLALFTIACEKEKEDDLSPEQVAQIKKDVAAATDTIVARFNRGDLNGALAIYHESPEFVMLGADGAKLDYAANKKASVDMVASAASIAITTKSHDCSVMTPELAICAWTGTEEVVLKAGDTVTYAPFAVTLVYKKFDDQWKVTYSHESGTVTTKKAAKK